LLNVLYYLKKKLSVGKVIGISKVFIKAKGAED